jgi:hypothetical protein
VVDQLQKLSFEAKVGRKASTDKINQLRPNPANTYPSEAHRCTDEQWIKAVKSMESNHKQIEKVSATRTMFITLPWSWVQAQTL